MAPTDANAESARGISPEPLTELDVLSHVASADTPSLPAPPSISPMSAMALHADLLRLVHQIPQFASRELARRDDAREVVALCRAR
jgi:hypothetical protein